MTRAVFFVFWVAVAIVAALLLVQNPGAVHVEWLGYQADMDVGVLVLATLVVMVISALLYRIWRGVLGAPASISRGRDRSRRMRGYQALTQGMVAVAAGDGDSATRLSRKADGLLDEPPLTMLLAAQAAQLQGDQQAARRYFESMLERPETEFLALRGLLNQALRDDDPIRALDLAQRARAIHPTTPWVVQTCLDLQVRQRRWVEAQDSLTAAVKARLVDAPDARHHKTAILIERSREAEGDGRINDAVALAHQAVSLLPDFAPAVVREARALDEADRGRQAQRLVEKTWVRAPHRDLADVFAVLTPFDDDPVAHVRRIERLYKLRPDHVESRLAMAQAHLQAQQWGQAREMLEGVAAERPTRRVFRLLSDLETGEGQNAEAAREWLLKAEEAVADEAWVCRVCGTVAPVWTAVCGHCGAFDSLEWTTPTVAVHQPALTTDRPTSGSTLPPPD